MWTVPKTKSGMCTVLLRWGNLVIALGSTMSLPRFSSAYKRGAALIFVRAKN